MRLVGQELGFSAPERDRAVLQQFSKMLIAGAFVIVTMSDQLASSGFEGIGIITGSVFILVVLLFRRGIWGTVRHLWISRRGSKQP